MPITPHNFFAGWLLGRGVRTASRGIEEYISWPPDTAAVIYRAENLDPDVTYTDFILTEDNYAKIGYTDEVEDLYIPAAFLDSEDNTWYKVVTIRSAHHFLTGGMFDTSVALTNVYIPETVTSVENRVFYECDTLKRIYLNSTLAELSGGKIGECENLEAIYVKPENPVFYSDGGILFWKTDGLIKLLRYPENKPGDYYEIPANVDSIASSAFEGARQLKTVHIPNTVTNTGMADGFSAFAYSSVYEVQCRVSQIAQKMFSYCANLSSVKLSDTTTTIVTGAFQGCTALQSIRIPAGMKMIYPEVFLECSSLKEVIFEDPTGWEVAEKSYSSDTIAVDLSDPATAADLLVNTYASYYFIKE